MMATTWERDRAKADKKAAKQEKLTETTEKRRDAQEAADREGEGVAKPEEREASAGRFPPVEG
jgi:hypothetical protein